MSEKDNQTISILTTHVRETGKPHKMFPSIAKLATKSSQITIKKLEETLSNFVKILGKIVERLPEPKGSYNLDALTFSVSVDGAGKISLVGELSAGFTSGMTITFKRKHGG